MDKLRIALISTPFFGVPPPKYGGLELIVYDLACGLTKLGHKVVIFAPKGSQIPLKGFVYETGEPLNTVQVDWLKAEEDMWKVYKDKLKEFDIINGMNWFGFEYASKNENPNLRICHTHHGHINPDWWCKNKPPFKLNFISLSKFMQAEYRNIGIESQYCYNGVDLDKYPYQEKKGDRLLFVGRLDSFKRPHIAIEVAKKMNLSLDIVGGSFVGDVQYMNTIKQTCDGNQIKLYLDSNQEEKVRLYQNAKCVIFPSKMGEPFGLVGIEGLSCGTPVIASNDGGIPESIIDGKVGFICQDVNEMIEALKKIDKIDHMECRKWVAENFSREVMSQNYLKLYEKILAGEEW